MEEEAGQPGQKTSSDVNNQDRDGCMDQRSEGHHNTENHIDQCTWQGKKPVPFILASNGYHSTVWVQAPVPRMKLTYWSSFEAMVLYNRCRMYKQDLRTHEIRIEQIRRQNREEVERSWRSSAASTSPNENWWDSWWWNGEWWEGQTNSPSSIEDDDGDVENCKPKAKPMPIRRGVVVLPKPKPRVIPPRNLDAVEESIATTGTEGSKTGEPGPSQPEKQSSAAILERRSWRQRSGCFARKPTQMLRMRRFRTTPMQRRTWMRRRPRPSMSLGMSPTSLTQPSQQHDKNMTPKSRTARTTRPTQNLQLPQKEKI